MVQLSFFQSNRKTWDYHVQFRHIKNWFLQRLGRSKPTNLISLTFKFLSKSKHKSTIHSLSFLSFLNHNTRRKWPFLHRKSITSSGAPEYLRHPATLRLLSSVSTKPDTWGTTVLDGNFVTSFGTWINGMGSVSTFMFVETRGAKRAPHLCLSETRGAKESEPGWTHPFYTASYQCSRHEPLSMQIACTTWHSTIYILVYHWITS